MHTCLCRLLPMLACLEVVAFVTVGLKRGTSLEYFRVAFPAWVIQDIRECMAQGHSEHDTTQYTIAVVEKAMHTLGIITLGLALYGEHGGCYVMLQDNQNVVF